MSRAGMYLHPLASINVGVIILRQPPLRYAMVRTCYSTHTMIYITQWEAMAALTFLFKDDKTLS